MSDLFTIAEKTLSQARAEWTETIKSEGGHCPCCDRWGKVYPRSINATMAKSLIWLAGSKPHGEWVDVANTAPRWLVRSNQLPTLRWWGLVQRAPNDDPHKKHSGMWRATLRGRHFAINRVPVPHKVYTYNGEPVDWSDEQRYVVDCFKERFDYQQVMQEYYDGR